MDIVVDFDGTCVTHDYPRIGKDIGAIPVLKLFVELGHRLILFTMRSGKELDMAISWFTTNGILLYGVQFNPEQKLWTTSPKALGDLYIDDAGICCPLKFDKSISPRPFADWTEVKRIVTSYSKEKLSL